jgi:hypothetical protein
MQKSRGRHVTAAIPKAPKGVRLAATMKTLAMMDDEKRKGREERDGMRMENRKRRREKGTK